jgi:uncharacterized protein YbcI
VVDEPFSGTPLHDLINLWYGRLVGHEAQTAVAPGAPEVAWHDETCVGVRNDLSTALMTHYRRAFGRGPATIATYEFGAGYVVFLHGVLSRHERFLARNGRGDLVREMRTAIREAESGGLMADVQRVTGRPVRHDAFQVKPGDDLAIELFWAPRESAGDAGRPATGCFKEVAR